MDRLSKLHPCLQSHIVSFLTTTEDAMKLAVLSSYWRNILSSLSQLTFKFTEHSKDKKSFKDCIERALVSHDKTDIEKFFLEVDNDDGFTESELSRWITILIQHNISRLELHIPTSKPTVLPFSLFTCCTLTELSLVEIKISQIPVFRLPKLIYFGLILVEFGDGSASYRFVNLSFSATSFPMLEELYLYSKQRIQSLSISIPTFDRLALRTINSPGLQLSISTLQKVHIFHEGLPVDISTIDIACTKTVSSITSATLRMDWSSELFHPSSPCHDASKILSGLRCTEQLSFNVSFIEFLCWDRSFSTQTQTISTNLKKLFIFMFRIRKDHVKMAKFLTRTLPQLQDLLIWNHDIPLTRMSEAELLVGDDIVMTPLLRTIRICNVKGVDTELKLAGHFLASAPKLEELTISFSVDTSVDTRKRVELYLMSSPKVSQQVSLVYNLVEADEVDTL